MSSRQRLHAGVGGGGFVESVLAAAGDDDLVAESVKGSASPRPMPEPPPVMRMVLPVGFISCMSPLA